MPFLYSLDTLKTVSLSYIKGPKEKKNDDNRDTNNLAS